MTTNRPAAAELADLAARHGGRIAEIDGHPRWWVTDPSSAAEDAAAHVGLIERRRLYQMRLPLPLDRGPGGVPSHPTISTRAFDPDRDTDAWLAVNNAAFAWHPDQGGWTTADLEARMGEPWFDLDDFRVTDRDGTLAGFCWTKVHPAGTTATEAIGEIYVIAVAPGHVGEGLGTALTVAGLDWLWTRHHTPIGMLYVEAGNDRALATYRRLGFAVHSTDVAFDPADGAGS